MHETTIKAILAAAAAALTAYMGEILVPVLVLCFVMLVDYITGVSAAYITHTLSSRVGLLGILKKLSYLAIVAVACVIDYIISMAGSRLGVTIAVQFVALLVVFWLIINELISILENVQKAGGPVPPFVGSLLNHLRGKVEKSMPELPETPEKGKHEK